MHKCSNDKIYKLYINIYPWIRGFIKSLFFKAFRKNIVIGKGARIKRNIEWRLFPGCCLFCGRNLIVGKDTTINIARNAALRMGDNVGIGNRCQIVSHKYIEIGEGTILAPNVMIYDHNHIFDAQNGVYQREFSDDEIVIGKYCWIGASAIILKGVHIGDRCIIGAGSLVIKDIPDNSVAVGSPAKVIKKIQ